MTIQRQQRSPNNMEQNIFFFLKYGNHVALRLQAVRPIGMWIIRQGVTGTKKLKSNPDVGSMNNLRDILAWLQKVFWKIPNKDICIYFWV